MKKYIFILFLATLLFSACDKGDGVIYGALKYSNGDGVPNVEIQLCKLKKSILTEEYTPVDQQLTKENGTYYFSSLPAGQYKICYSSSHTNYNDKEIGVKLSAGETKNIDLKY